MGSFNFVTSIAEKNVDPRREMNSRAGEHGDRGDRARDAGFGVENR